MRRVWEAYKTTVGVGLGLGVLAYVPLYLYGRYLLSTPKGRRRVIEDEAALRKWIRGDK